MIVHRPAQRFRRRFLSRLHIGLFALVLIAPLAMGGNARARQSASVLPPTAQVGGLSMGEWAARWWQWAYSIPAASNPLLDPTGANAASAQSGNVWFLVGTWGPSGTINRTVTIPSGKFLFFPVVNWEWDNYVCVEPDTSYTPDELRAIIRGYLNGLSSYSAEIDGVPVANISQYREESPVFSFTLPQDNIYLAIGCPDGVAGTYGPAVDTGIYLMVPPLSVGSHEIHFTVPEFGLDVTYNITVAPAGQYGK